MADDLVVSGIHLDARQTLREIRRLDRRLGQLEGQIDGAARSSKKAQKGFRSMATAVAGAAAAFGAFRAAERASRFIFRVNREFQQLEARLVSVTGSVEEAESSFQLITDFAQETPFQIQGLVEGFTNLQLRGIQPTAEMMRDLGNFAAAFGSDFTNLINAITRAAQGGTERLREGFGIPIRKIGDELEITFQGTTRRVEATNEALIGLFRDLSREHFPEAMARQMDTLVGSISNLEDTASVAANKVGEQGLNAAIQDLAGTIDEAIANNEAFAKSLGENLAAGVRVSTRTLEMFIEHSETIIRALKTLAAVVIARSLVPALKSIGFWMRAAAGGAVFLKDVLVPLRAAMATLGGPAGVFIAAVGAAHLLTNSFDDAVPSVRKLKEETDELRGAMEDLTEAEVENRIASIMDTIEEKRQEMTRLREEAQQQAGQGEAGGRFGLGVPAAANLAGTKREITVLDREVAALVERLGVLQEGLRGTADAADDSSESTREQVDAVRELISEIESEVDQLQFTDRQLARHTLELQGASDAEIAYAMTLFDASEALEEKADAEEEARKAEEKRIEDTLQHMEDQREANRQIREEAQQRSQQFAANLQLARMQEEIRRAERASEAISQAITDPLIDIVTETENVADAFEDMVTGILRQMSRLLMQEVVGRALTSLLGPLMPGGGIPAAPGPVDVSPPNINPTAGGVPGFQHGGSFEVPGSGGPDSKLVRFMATPGEQVTVSPKGRGGGATPVQEVHHHKTDLNLSAVDGPSVRRVLLQERDTILRILREGARRGEI